MIWPALAVGSAAGVAAWAVRAPRSSLLGPVIWQGSKEANAIALTFDDGPSESTPALLDLLDEHQAKAAFFVIGSHVRRWPAIAREIVARGHEIANHTMTHEALYLKSRDVIRREVRHAQLEIEEVTGVRPRWFRPPFGCRWLGLAEVLREADLRMVTWSAIGSDWRLPASAIAQKLERAARPGAIFCLHDGRQLVTNPDIAATIGAVRVIIPRLGIIGFRFPTLSQIICPTSSSNASSK